MGAGSTSSDSKNIPAFVSYTQKASKFTGN